MYHVTKFLFIYLSFKPGFHMIATIAEKKKFSYRSDHMETGLYCSAAPFRANPVINLVFGRLCRKTVSRGREDTRVWYQETMFSQMVSYDFLLHEPLHGYFLYLVCAPPEKPTKRCEPEEGYLRCSKRFDHGSHSIIFLLFEFKSVR